MIKQRAQLLLSSTDSTHNIAHIIDIGPAFPGPSLPITDADTIPETALPIAGSTIFLPVDNEVSVASEVDTIDDNLTVSVSKTVEVAYDKKLDTTRQGTEEDGLSEGRGTKRPRV